MTPFEQRLVRARASMLDASLDALLITHLPNVRYLCGFRGTAGTLVLTASRTILAVDFRYMTEARSLVAAQGGPAPVEVTIVERTSDETLVTLLQESGALRVGIEAAWMPVSRFNKLSGTLAGAAPTPLSSNRPCPVLLPTERVIERLRTVKDRDEIAILREAARRLSTVARRVPALVQSGRTERQVAAAIDAELRSEGFERPAFDTIVASGPNSALPHARPGERQLQAGDGVVLDFGGVYDGYCVDLTRTVQLGAPFGDFRRIFAAVAEAQRAALEVVRPGVLASEVDGAARDVLARHGLAEAFGHGTGHGIGLEVHEEPRIGRPVPGQPDEPLEPGMVFTIEPGAYVPGVGGVRLEDDVLVTVDGYEMLTDVPIELM
jgi:Xaa-Pro aminopeptidase